MEAAHTPDVAARYARFASHEAAHHSAAYQAWAQAVADDPRLAELVAELPEDKRQPNIVFACARMLDAVPGDAESLHRVLTQQLDELAALAAGRSTQTNEAARLGVLLPVLAHLSSVHDGAPLALLEVGASAGLCLWPERWSYRYTDRAGSTLAAIHTPEAIGELPVVVKEPLHRCGIALPRAVPPVAVRAGLDLNPLDPADPDDRHWLQTLVWPGQDHRLARLEAALDDAAQHPSPVTAGDLRDPETLDALLSLSPAGSVPVLSHTAVMAYLDQADRTSVERDLLGRVHARECHWISNEGQQVLPGLRERIGADAELEASLRKGSFVVALDGEPLYQADGHAGWLLG